MNMYRYRVSTLIEKGNGEQIWLSFSMPTSAWAIADAQARFAELMKPGEPPLTLDQFDRTGAARGLTDDDIDLVWTGVIKAERIF